MPVAIGPHPYHIPRNARSVECRQEFCTRAVLVLFDAAGKVALHKTEVVFGVMKFRFEVYEVNHKKCFLKEKGKKESTLKRGCLGRPKGNGINGV
jgi:hypothetical protein